MGRLTTQAIAADSRYFNREVSWLRFNRRVLEEAEDERSPLLERARFLAIVSSNLDEFCMVRLARLYLNRLLDDGQRDAAGFSRQQHLDAVRNDIRILVEEQYLCWNQQVRPLLAEAGIQLLPRDRWNEEDLRSLAAYYHDNIEPVLTPMAVDAGHPFPLVANQALYVACDLTHSGMRKRALVAVPAGGRLVPLPARAGCYVLLEDVVAHFLDSLFPGSQVHERLILRVTRDGAIDIDEDQAIDLLSEIEEELRQRAFGDPVRLEISSNDSGVIDEGLASWLQQCLELEDANVFRIPGALDLRLLFELANRENQAELQYPSFEPQPCPVDWSDPFATLRQEELFLHHPFQ
ncbi:MAG: RNA degradosome polyphosphate kinase, partial [Planctomycetota bacterium]